MTAFRNTYTGALQPGTKVSLGGRLHDAVVSARLKPGSRAYFAIVRNLVIAGAAARTEAPDTVAAAGVAT
jgi:hypothetical protein